MNKIKPLDQVRPIVAEAFNHGTKLNKTFQQSDTILGRLIVFASSVPDFRRTDRGNHRHKLSDMILLMIFGRLSGCVGRAEILEFGKHNLNRLRKLGILMQGIPSEATLCRVENGIHDLTMADCMQDFISAFHDELSETLREKEIICIDGKAERGTVLANGRNPDIVSAYSYNTGITLATEACQNKSNEIRAVPRLIDKIDITGKIVTADAMSMQKEIIDKIRSMGGDFIIELKANQPTLRYGVEDRLINHAPAYSYTVGPELGHGRIETRIYRIYEGLELIADKAKWGGNLTVIEYEAHTIRKSTGCETTEKRLYISSLPIATPNLGSIIRSHWSIESMHWNLDYNLKQDNVRRKYPQAARNLDTIQRITHSLFSIWKGRRKKKSDKRKGMAQLMRGLSRSFTAMLAFLKQN